MLRAYRASPPRLRRAGGTLGRTSSSLALLTPAVRAGARALLLAGVLAAPAARGHEVLHEVVPGRAVAVHVFESDGAPLAACEYRVYSPSGPADRPHQTGRTDRNGWLAFVPDVGGRWRVQVVEDGGHGLDLTVDTAALVAPSPARGGLTALGRTAIGAGLLLAVFAGVAAVQRWRRSR